MSGGKGNIKPHDGKQFSSDYKPQEKWTEENALKLGNELIEWISKKGKKNIFFQEFLFIKTLNNQKTISYLSNKFTSFLTLIVRAKKIQEIKLLKYGIANKLNASMTKFVLANHHGYREKKEVKTETIHTVDLNNFTEEEKRVLLNIARKREHTS